MKTKVIIIIVLIAIICFALGYIVGNKTNINILGGQEKDATTDLIGTYECDNWNGQKAYISILDNENMIYMGQKCTYTIEGNILRAGWNELTIVPNGLTKNDRTFIKTN